MNRMESEKGRNVRLDPYSLEDLLRSRSNLQHLIYSMEHDRSLNAENTRIVVLKELLTGIEQQIDTRQVVH